MNIELLKRAVNHIIEHPESWDQNRWHSACNTKHCMAGLGQFLGGLTMSSATAEQDGRRVYGLTREDADWLFDGSRGLRDIYSFVKAAEAGVDFVCSYAGRDENGFDWNGFDIDGNVLPLFDLK